MRTLLIGIDAACSRVLDPLFDAGVTPTLRDIFEDGVSGRLDSQIPPWTPSAWPSVYTGVNPGKHGAYSFLSFDGYDWDVVNRSDVEEYALWELLDRHGLSSVVVNVPVTHPPSEIDGAVVPGYIAPEDPECHPAGVLEDIRSEIGDYRIYGERGGDADEQAAEYCELTRMRGRAFSYLADRFDPDFGFVQFQQTDTVFHEHPDRWDIVEEIYATVDEEIAAIVEDHDPDTVLVVSDHGIGEYDGYEFRINEFLDEQGYIERTAGDGGMPSWSSIARNELQTGRTDGNSGRSPLERSLSMAAKVGITSQRLAAVVERLGLTEFVLDRVSTDTVRAATEQVDFERSTAYMRSRIELGVRINLQGREPGGVVAPEEYDAVRDRLISSLRSVETPDGDPMFDAVVPRERLFEGKRLEAAPDVVTVPADFDNFLSASLLGEQFAAPSDPWNHKIDGAFAAAGEAIGDADPTSAHLFDVAPTVLATMGVPASDRMDGAAMPFVEPSGTTEYPTYDRATTVSTDDDGVEQQLTSLGYLE
uniref:Predicted phosphohydrolase or phosphomutase, AlkP superfamily n=1 Tax=Natronoarchaeum philippinense TaxID=558529 RepID=A0A285P9Z5_NATPI|nr:alkaline phosphatase family protein [Natronoarchaeum philippinense]SNZ16956.1 Predicted phosphohydrolase or phosphomutase, AlkP superfamily [Natronoarchaeum philippinense]